MNHLRPKRFFSRPCPALASALAWLLTLGLPLPLPKAAAEITEQEQQDGFVSLFDGKTLAGWTKMGDAGFVARNGMIVCNGRGNWPTWLRTNETYENFVLRLEYKGFYGAESGVFFQAPLHGLVSRTGYEIQLGDNRGRLLKHSPGAVFGVLPPIKEAAKRYNDPEYNTLEIKMEWPQLQVRLNEVLVQDVDVSKHEELKFRPRSGYIGFQDRGKPVHFRNIRVKRLPSPTEKQWQALFNGKDLSGWTISEKCSATWTVEEDGAVLGKEGHGYLITDGAFQDCEFSTYIRSSPLANGGIFFRWKTERDRGFEIQIEDIPDSNDPTGSIYGRVRAEQLPLIPGEWVLMQVFLQDRHCAVRVNGVTVAESHEMPRGRPGNISLQMHTGKGWVRWKDAKVRKLAPVGDDAK